jgi:hypothetical protein
MSEHRLNQLERQYSVTDSRLDNVENMLASQGQKIDQIVSAVTQVSAKPVFNPAAILSFVRDAAVLIGLAASSIIYIATNISDKPVALLSQRIDSVEQRMSLMPSIGLGWKPTQEERKP